MNFQKLSFENDKKQKQIQDKGRVFDLGTGISR